MDKKLEQSLIETIDRILNENYITQDQLEESLKEHEHQLVKNFEIEKRLSVMEHDLSFHISDTISKGGNFRKHKSLFMVEDYKRANFVPYVDELGYNTVNDHLLVLLEKELEKEKEDKEKSA